MEYFSGSLATPRLTVVVGGPGENSRVKTNQGELLVKARAGEAGQGWYGGDGYSGGAGACCGAADNPGGRDGGEGGGDLYNRGQGSGLDISSLSLTHFSLSPGAGGRHLTGGGGGGVLVNSLGPRVEQGRGEGYGGGGEGNIYGLGRGGDVQSGASGVVIMEIRLREDYFVH